MTVDLEAIRKRNEERGDRVMDLLADDDPKPLRGHELETATRDIDTLLVEIGRLRALLRNGKVQSSDGDMSVPNGERDTM